MLTNYEQVLKQLFYRTKCFYFNIVDTSHNKDHISVPFISYVDGLVSRERRIQTMSKVFNRPCATVCVDKINTELSTDEISALLTTVLHQTCTHTDHVLPYVQIVLEPNASDTVSYDDSFNAVLLDYPEVWATMERLPIRSGVLKLEVGNTDIPETYSHFTNMELIKGLESFGLLHIDKE